MGQNCSSIGDQFEINDRQIKYEDSHQYGYQIEMEKKENIVLPLNNQVLATTISPSGQYFAVGYSNAQIIVYDLDFPQKFKSFIGHTLEVSSVIFKNDKFIFSGSYDCSIICWDMSDQSEFEKKIDAHDDFITSMDISQNGRILITGSQDRTCKVWESTTLICIKKIQGHMDSIDQVLFTPSCKMITTVSSDRSIILWDAESFTQLQRQMHLHNNGWGSLVSYSDEDKLMVVAGPKNNITIVDTKRASIQNQIFEAFDTDVRCVQITKNGLQIFAGDHEGLIKVFETQSLVLQKCYSIHFDYLRFIKLDNTCNQKMVTACSDSVCVWNMKYCI